MKQLQRMLLVILSVILITGSLAACTSNETAKNDEPKQEEKTKDSENKLKEQVEASVYEDVTDEESDVSDTTDLAHAALVNNAPPKVANEQSNVSANEKRMVKATVVKNIDGDTIKVKLENGKEENVRFLLIDTPETKHPKLGVQPFGPEASAFVKRMAPVGKEVTLEFDVSDREKYGRLLAYIWVDGQMLNRMIVEQGLARVGYIYAPNTKYVDYLKETQTKAQQAKRGIWSIEDYATDKGYNASKVTSNTAIASTPSTKQEPKQEVKPKSEPKQNNNVYYKNCAAAKAAGAAPVHKGDPGYGKHLDGDGDGVGCER
ncbi:thermonuclease family protein [Priestia taiwanensis]|uniref:SPBc2 prophage-derived endonuclease YokF n=1 Tax=Priestia taiwanensis TaxID=1347902 RepID=A0A917ASS6_9BACI|nr:thermonuclease family protein [Priestia taiwanensis]MBM7364225.1 micrococcal nuclease [Priestia taiwanensis]GGE72668.1 SPBc2 prophage-derived endonuclease YokF [Priestia taiwanensis]